ncbi:MAG: type II secretion system F family protein, partial [Candidatus Omnitrophica bacterium]|nr:type II secretion system F family protein [Candidatus Omnitrophota bacterium]
LKGIRKKVSLKELVAFTQKLATLTKARVELLGSLKILYEQTEDSRFKEIILELYTLVKEGKTFSDALKGFPGIFPPLYGSLVAAGEASGNLDSALEQLADFLYSEHSLKNKIMVALAYPALLLSVGLTSVFVLINFVVPRLKPIFQNLGKDLPLITKIVLNLSVVSRNLWFWIAGGVAIVIALVYLKKGSRFMSNLSGKIAMNLPVIKRLKEDQELTHFARALRLLLGGGVTALKALEIASPTVASPRLRAELKVVCAKVAGGSRLSESMEGSKMLPAFFVKMIAVGEESGRLAEVLDDITKSYTQEIESDIALISSLLEPVLILGLGLILGTIVLAVLLPTFQATQLVH